MDPISELLDKAAERWARGLCIGMPQRQCPLFGCLNTSGKCFVDFISFIIHLNDTHAVTFTEIADLLEREGMNIELY